MLAMRPNTVLWCEALRRAPSPPQKKSPCLLVLGSECETEALSPQWSPEEMVHMERKTKGEEKTPTDNGLFFFCCIVDVLLLENS